MRRARLRFAAIFVVVGGVLMALYSFPYAGHGIREDGFVAFLSFYARLTGAVLRLFDGGVHVVGTDIVGRTTLTVAKNCDAMDINILFAAAVVASPAPWRRRALGLLVGLPALVVVNVVRIATLYFVELRAPRAFEVVHAEVWPLALVAIAVAAFLSWSRWAQPAAAEA
ncbi:MAG TPA: archaeosortase/exosortase family protein [Polyangia bacterium]|nr:archaeosortase/exosortase family protein [Polyangia bacterium]